MTQANDIRDMAEAKLRELPLPPADLAALLANKAYWRVGYNLVWDEAWAYPCTEEGTTLPDPKLTWSTAELRRWQATHKSRPDRAGENDPGPDPGTEFEAKG